MFKILADFLTPNCKVEKMMSGERNGTFKLPDFPSSIDAQLFRERDCKVICGSRTFKLHSKLLVSKSKFFAQQLGKTKEDNLDVKQAFKEVEVPDIDPTVFGEVVQYLYDGLVGNLSEERLAEQMMVAEKLGIEQLKDELSEQLMLRLTEENVVEIAALAQRCNANQLLEKSVKLIVENSVKMSKEEVVKYPSLVVAILEEYSNETSVKKEEIAVVKEGIVMANFETSSFEF